MSFRAYFAVLGVAVASAACTSILGDFTSGSSEPIREAGADGAPQKQHDAGVSDAHYDGHSQGKDAPGPSFDTGSHDVAERDTGHDAGCGTGQSLCESMCVDLSDASAHCGKCERSCNGASCAAGACTAYALASPPATGAIGKIATDGTHVVWVDTANAVIRETPAAEAGTPILIVPVSPTNGGVGNELALANGVVAFVYGTGAPSVGLANVDVADSGASIYPGILELSAVSLTPNATHVFFFNTAGTEGSLEDCPLHGFDAGTCVSPNGGGRLGVAQTAADGTFMFYDFDGEEGNGLYLDTIASNSQNEISGGNTQSLAVDGTWAYWTVVSDAGPPDATTYTVVRVIEATMSNFESPVTGLANPVFATDGTNVYYFTGSSVAYQPVGGGPVTVVAAATGVTQIAVGGSLLIWTDGTTLWGAVL